jgi:hypothetical protein
LHLTKTRSLSTFLPSLYQEYQDLSSKLFKISDLIVEYGGELPEKDISPTVQCSELQATSIIDSTSESTKTSVVENTPADSNNNNQYVPELQLPIVVNNVLKAVTKPIKPVANKAVINSIPLGFEYPSHKAAWEKKILYSLRISGKPCTGKEIVAFMQKHEPTDRASVVESSVRQYAGNLVKKGVIEVDKSAHAHKYFLKT